MPDEPKTLVDEEAQERVRKLPNMNEFSPGVLQTSNIRTFLTTLLPYDGNRDAMVDHIASSYPKIKATQNSKQRTGRAHNVLIGMSQCGLLEKEDGQITAHFTPLAKDIARVSDDAAACAQFARHLLQHCFGLELVDAVELIKARGETVTLDAIRTELRARGFVVTENEGNASKVRQWLECTGVVDEEWNIDDSRLRQLIGATSTVLAKWYNLSRAQRVLLEELKRADELRTGEWIAVREIKRLCESRYGRSVFPEGRLRAEVIDPLVEDGWIDSRGTGKGRGGDSGELKVRAQLRDVKIKLPAEGMSGVPTDLRDKLARPLDQIFSDLNSPNTHTKGLALELLALRLTRDVGLFPVCFRERSAQTNGAEVDLIANGVHLHYSRWLIQCKNTKSVHVHDIAKEVGMAVVLKAHVIALVTTGQFSRAVHNYANGLAASSALQAVLIDGDLLRKYKSAGQHSVMEWLQKNAVRVLSLKEPQVQEVEE